MTSIRYSLVRGLVASLVLSAWAYLVLSLGVTGFFANALLAYATVQLFESVSRESAAPSLPDYGSLGREVIAVLFAVVMALVAGTSDLEVELSPSGESLLVVLFTGGAYLFSIVSFRGSARDATAALETQRKALTRKGIMRPLRLHIVSMVGLLVLAWTLSLNIDWPANHPKDAMGMTMLILVGAILTGRRAAASYWAHYYRLQEGDQSLAARVEAARNGQGPSVLFQLRARAVMDEFVRFEHQGAERPPIVRVPYGVFPELAPGEWVLAEEPVVVESVGGGGDGYRAGEQYERLDQCKRYDVLQTLPPRPRAPIHPVLVEIGLIGFVVLVTGVGMTLGRHMHQAGL